MKPNTSKPVNGSGIQRRIIYPRSSGYKRNYHALWCSCKSEPNHTSALIPTVIIALPQPEGKTMKTAYARIEAVAPFQFLAIIRGDDTGRDDYLELTASTPTEALQAIEQARSFLESRGVHIAHIEVPAECHAANCGGELSKYRELRKQVAQVKRHLERRRPTQLRRVA